MLTEEIWNRFLDMNCYNEVKRWWLPMWYVFFYRKNGGKN